MKTTKLKECMKLLKVYDLPTKSFLFTVKKNGEMSRNAKQDYFRGLLDDIYNLKNEGCKMYPHFEKDGKKISYVAKDGVSSEGTYERMITEKDLLSFLFACSLKFDCWFAFFLDDNDRYCIQRMSQNVAPSQILVKWEGTNTVPYHDVTNRINGSVNRVYGTTVKNAKEYNDSMKEIICKIFLQTSNLDDDYIINPYAEISEVATK